MASVGGLLFGPIWVNLPSAFHKGQLKENAPMSMEQARAAIRAATDTSALPAIQLRALLPATELPPHAALGNETSSVPVHDLAAVVLNQSLAFMEGVFPAFSIQDNFVKSKGSDATVSTRVLERGKERWYGRSSRHANQKTVGTADWDQFNEGLREAHNRQQLEYVSDIEDAFKVCDWGVAGVEGWENVTVEVFEMLHKESLLSKPRSYPVLVVTASSTESNQFIITQLPVDLSTAAGARYANGKNTIDVTANTSSTMGKKSMVTECISIDRVKLGTDPKMPDAEPEIVWECATASAGRSGMSPGMTSKSVIAKDVGLFVEWVNRK